QILFSKWGCSKFTLTNFYKLGSTLGYFYPHPKHKEMEAKSHTQIPTLHSLLIKLVTLIFIVSNLSTTVARQTTTTTTTNSFRIYRTYVARACKSTLYPSLCYRTLVSHSLAIKKDHLRLCKFSLSKTVNSTRAAYLTISKTLKQGRLTRYEAPVVKDCVENVKDSLEKLRNSLNTMGNLRGKNKAFEIDNIKTWMSAAITDEDTCMEGFKEMKVNGKVKNKIRISVGHVARMTSNALALINHLK
ncbi:21 kDa protein-like, partial [Quillaja saponaria]